MTRLGILALASIALAPAAALGQVPSFVTLDRHDDVSRFGLQIGLSKPDEVPGLDDVWGLRTELHGQFLLAGSSGGFYGQFPLTHLLVDDGPDETAVGDLELGGIFLLGSAAQLVSLRFGLAVPTASEGDREEVANDLTRWERITDRVSIVPDVTWLRASVSPHLRARNLIFRADGGLDFAIAGDYPNDVLGRINAGLMALAGGIGFSFELANAGWIDGDGDADDRWNHTLAVALHSLGPNQFHFGLVLPLDEGARGDLLVLSFGLKGAL